jgi:hypothetical protein
VPVEVAIDDTRWAQWTVNGHGHDDEVRLPHLVAVARSALGADVGVIEGAWTERTLATANVLVLPFESGRQALPPAEARWLRQFVAAGGGLLLLAGAERDGSRTPLVAADLLDLDELGIAPSPVAEARPSAAAHLLTYDIVAAAVAGHPAVDGVASVFVHRARPLRMDGAAVTPLIVRGDDVVAAAGDVGEGRVAVVGSAEMLAPPFLGREGNARFLVNLMAWLAGASAPGSPGSLAGELVGTRPRRDRGDSAVGDLAAAPGPHLVDVGANRSDLERLTAGLPDPYRDREAFLLEAELRYGELPRAVRRTVAGFRHRSNEHGVLLVRGLPGDPDLPATPEDPQAIARKDTSWSELWLAMVATALGSPFGYVQEKRGEIYQNVVPTPQNADKLCSEGSRRPLGFHTENPFHPHPPDYLLLHCLRPDHERVAMTTSASVRTVLPCLSLRARALLGQARYRVGIDTSFGSPDGTMGNGPTVPILSGDPYDPFMAVDLDLMVGLDAEAQAALEELQAAIDSVTGGVRLDAGDLLVIDNRRAGHGRSEFTARFDGRDRWLQRMYVIRDLAPSASDRIGQRVIATGFAI